MFGLFAVETAHATRLQINRSTGRLVSGWPAAVGPARPLVLYIPSGALACAFLMAAETDAGYFQIAGDPTAAPIISLRLQRDRNASTAALCQPFSGRYLCAVPPMDGSDQGDVVLERETRGGWETFTLIPVDVADCDPAISATIATIEQWAIVPTTGPRMLDLIERELAPATRDVFAAVARLLPRDQISWLGPTILGRPTAIANLAATFQDDLFFAKAIPDLSVWLAARPRLVHQHLDPDLDRLAEIGIDGNHVSFGHLCSSHARRLIPARQTICILATARNEGIYLLEWIAYHRSIGVEDFFIYSNDNSDGSDVLLEALARGGAINWISSKLSTGQAAQPKAYGHALALLPHILDNRWSLIIDLDEFFVFDHNRFASIQDYIAWQEARPVDAIALNWMVYGSSGEHSWRDEPLTSRFVQRLPWSDPHIKTMVRTNLAMHSRPHHPSFDAAQSIITRNAAGDAHASAEGGSFSAHPDTGTAWINHYFLKSAEEFVWKFARNRGDHALVATASPTIIDASFADMFVQQHTSPHVTRDDRILGCAGGQARQMELLLALPGVQEAALHVRQGYTSELARLKALIRSEPLFRILNTPYNELATLLGI